MEGSKRIGSVARRTAKWPPNGQARDIVMRRRVLGRVGACTQRVGREQEEERKISGLVGAEK